MSFWRYLPASPPLPHPKWAQSVAPAGKGGRQKPLYPPYPAGAAARTHDPCALPPRGRVPQQTGNSEMSFGRYLPASPPLPHPKWAQSVAPAGKGGRLKPLYPPYPAGAAARTHDPCALPPRGRVPQFNISMVKKLKKHFLSIIKK